MHNFAFFRTFLWMFVLLTALASFAAEQHAGKPEDFDLWLEEYMKIATSFASPDMVKSQYAEAFASGNIFASLALEDWAKIQKEEEEARKWAAASQSNNVVAVLRELGSSDMRAQTLLGGVYREGLAGTGVDDALAVEWFRKAAEQSYAFAQDWLGFMYFEGRGVPKDDAKAVEWYQKAAEQGFASAQGNLGIMYAAGRGVPQDDALAVECFASLLSKGLPARSTFSVVCIQLGVA